MVYHYTDATTRRSSAQSAAGTFKLVGENRQPEGIADPPTLSVREPESNSSLPSGQTVVLAGQVLEGTHPAAVRVNGQAVDSLDAAGNFFHQSHLAPGVNTFTVEASDSTGGTATSTLTPPRRTGCS
jgi:hypothetical protein